VRQYLEAEIRHVLGHLHPMDSLLELGCGYGRVAVRLAEVARRIVGIDTAEDSLTLAREIAGADSRCEFLRMNALELEFPDGAFDTVVCVQNGICAFGVDQVALVREALRVLREGGLLLFSTYSDRFWPHRLAWFEAQAAADLLGPIDRNATGDGTIVCEDGFRAGRLTPEDLRSLCSQLGVEPGITEVDRSSVFCKIVKGGPEPRSKRQGEDVRRTDGASGNPGPVPTRRSTRTLLPSGNRRGSPRGRR
jgi:2-polyprenyl-6-hydroxyphenyl methylase/3-demethylubiquinone-9 3-methyltransferase